MNLDSNYKCYLVSLTHQVAQEELAEYEQLANVVVAGDTAATSGSHSPRVEVEVAGVTAATSGRQSQKAEVEPPEQAGVQQLLPITKAVQKPLEEMPHPAPGHHDSETHPEFDKQPVPMEHRETIEQQAAQNTMEGDDGAVDLDGLDW